MTTGGPPAGVLRAFVSELARAGLREAVVCPGSRSAPLALALRASPRIRVFVLIDERSAGFFALGMAKAARRPVAVVTTSGTAAANLLPAVVEAEYGRVPLVILTADRPPELRDRGAAQTIDQVGLFGRSVKWFVDVPVPDETSDLLAHFRGLAGRAVHTAAAGPAGPVHLNFPFREPLIPAGSLLAEGSNEAGRPEPGGPLEPYLGAVDGARRLSSGQLADLAARVRSARRGLIVAGPLDRPGLPAAVARLARATAFPILADPLSGMRRGPHDRSQVVVHADHLVRRGRFAETHPPDLVLRFGAPPTSKPLLTLLAAVRPRQLIVDGDGGWLEPTLGPATLVHADPVLVCEDLAALLEAGAHQPGNPPVPGTASALDPGWCASWLDADRRAARAMAGWLAALEEPFEGQPFADLGDLLPDGSILWAGSSMPVRDLDAWLESGPRAVRVLANRGANGIDGVVSSALGAAAVNEGPVVLVLGDLALLHDLGGLVAGRLHRLTATIVVVNNDGGGIFSFLPQAAATRPEVGLPEHYEELFGTPHGIAIPPLAQAFGATARRVGPEPGALRQALAHSLEQPGVQLFELPTDRRRNVELHREVAAAVVVAVADGDALADADRGAGAGSRPGPA